MQQATDRPRIDIAKWRKELKRLEALVMLYKHGFRNAQRHSDLDWKRLTCPDGKERFCYAFRLREGPKAKIYWAAGQELWIAVSEIGRLKARLTKLYSLRAHARGRLHMTRRKYSKVGKNGNTFWTMSDQEKMIADVVGDFVCA